MGAGDCGMADQVPRDGEEAGGPEVPSRYAYDKTSSKAIGWWSEGDGIDPPAAVQHPRDAVLEPERAFRLPVIAAPVEARAVLPADAGWPVGAAPFSFAEKEEVLGVWLATYLHPYIGPFDAQYDVDELSRIPVHGPAYDDLNSGAALEWLGTWFRMFVGDPVPVKPTLAWVARLLGCFLWSVEPRTDLTIYDYDSSSAQARGDVALARMLARCAVVGGGNLDVLLCLTWYAIADAAKALRVALRRCPQRVDNGYESGLGVDPQFAAALAGIGAVPATDLVDWSARPASFGAPIMEPLWGKRRPTLYAQTLGDSLVALSALAAGTSSDRARSPTQFSSSPRARVWDMHMRRNIHVYSDFSLRMLRVTVGALRLVLHVAFRASLFYSHGPSWDPRDPPSGYCTALDRLAGAPVHGLHTWFDRFARQCSLPRAILWRLEVEFYRHGLEVAPRAVADYWGVPPDRPDGFGRAGALCPADSFYVRFPVQPAPGAVPNRQAQL